MKRKLFIYLCFFIAIFTMSSCGGDDDDYEKKEKRVNLVEYKVFCNNPIAHIDIWDGRDSPEVAIGTWSSSFSTKSYSTGLNVICKEDKKATVKIQLYVNKRLVREVSGYGRAKLHYKLK